VTPLRASGLKLLVGERVCAVVYKSDVSINYGPLNGSLKGSNLGQGCVWDRERHQADERPSGSLPQVEAKVLDSDAVCSHELALLSAAPVPASSSLSFDVIP